MSSEFDPYRIWLGIPVNEQPANHYRLLGLALFESDADVISNAADRQMAHVRTFQTGKYSAQSQKVLNELSAARVTLLDSDKKAEYDAKLRAEIEALAGASVVNLGAHVPPPGISAGVSGIGVPPVVNGESSMLGMPLDLSSTNKKKYSTHDKRTKSAPVTTHSSGKRTSPKVTTPKENNSMIVFIGIGSALALIVIVSIALLASSSSEKVASDEVDTNDFSISPIDSSQFTEPLPQKPAPTKHKPPKPAHKTKQRASEENEITVSLEKDTTPEPTSKGTDDSQDSKKEDENNGTPSPEKENGKNEKSNDSDSTPHNDSGTGNAETIDWGNLNNKSGLVTTYTKSIVQPIYKVTLDGSEQVRVSTLTLDSKAGFMYVGNNAKGDSSVLNLQTGTVEHEFSLLEPGQFVAFSVSGDGQQYYLATCSTKEQQDLYQSVTNSSDFLSSRDPKDCRPNSFIFRWDADGQPHKESNDSQHHAFYTAKGYEILNIAAPVQCDSGTMAVGMSDGLVHVISMESGTEYMSFYPSDSEPPAMMWQKEIDDNKKNNFKKFFCLLTPEALPTVLIYNSNSKYLATGNSNGEVFVWDIDSNNPVADSEIENLNTLEHKFSVKKSSSPVRDLHFDSTGKNLYIFWADGQIAVWDWAEQKEMKTFSTGFPIQYAQIMGDKYLLTQNLDGEIKFWDWASEDIKPVGKFLKKTELVIADKEKSVFLATDKMTTDKGNTKPKLKLYALPENFVEAEKEAQFAKLFRAIVIYPVPEDSQWQAKSNEAKAMVTKSLAEVSADQKADKICAMSHIIADSRNLSPEKRYALYMELISELVELQNRDKISVLVDDMAQEFEVDKLELTVQAYFRIFDKQKNLEAKKTASLLLDLSEKISKTGNYQRALQIVEQVRKGSLNDDLRSRSMVLLKVYKDELKKNQKSN